MILTNSVHTEIYSRRALLWSRRVELPIQPAPAEKKAKHFPAPHLTSIMLKSVAEYVNRRLAYSFVTVGIDIGQAAEC